MMRTELIVIGGSAGSIEALATILPAFPATFRIPIVVVVHIPATAPSYLAEVFQNRCRLAVREPDDKEPIRPGKLYVAPPNYHLLVERGGLFALSVDDPLWFSRPSIDVLFESAADALGPAVAGVLLTGANDDGASGLARIERRGGLAFVQSPATATVPTMPAAGLARLNEPHVLALEDIGPVLARLDAPLTEGENTP